MSYKLLSKFYYTFPIYKYIVNLFTFKSSNSIVKLFNIDRIYFHNYARTGLKLLLTSTKYESVNVGVQLYTCHTILQAIKDSGHNIIFIDIKENFKLDLKDLEKKKSHIDILILTHTFGYPENFDEIKEILPNKIIIEDCAHAFLSVYKGKYVGTLGDASFFSIGIGKLPSVGQGGFSIVNNEKVFPSFVNYYNKYKNETKFSEIVHFFKLLIFSIILRPPVYGLVTYNVGKSLDSKFDFVQKKSSVISRGYRLDRKFFLNNLDLFKKNIEINNRNFILLTKELCRKETTDLPKNSFANNYIFPMLVTNRDDLFDILLRNDLETGKHFHNAIIWAKEFGYELGSCPTTEIITKKIITLPIHNGVSSENVKTIVNLINSYAK